MMHQVIEKHLPVGQKTRPAEDRLASETQLPRLGPRVILRVLERRASLRCAIIESLDQLRSGLERHRRHLRLAKIELWSRKNNRPKSCQLRHMRSKFVQ